MIVGVQIYVKLNFSLHLTNIFKSAANQLITLMRRNNFLYFEGKHKICCFLADDINMNSLDYWTSSIVKQFFNLSFQNDLTPLTNRPTRVSRTSATCIDQILRNSFVDSIIVSRIIKADRSDHFEIFCSIKVNEKYHSNDVTTLKRDKNKDTVSDFKYPLKFQVCFKNCCLDGCIE